MTVTTLARTFIPAVLTVGAAALLTLLLLRQNPAVADTASAGAVHSPRHQSVATQVFVNRAPVDPLRLPGKVSPGRYWYDHLTGAFGGEGGPTLGLVSASLDLPGPLHADASGGGDGRLSGVFINGRELHPQDVAGLVAVLGTVVPGRYWVDARGNFGYEGGQLLGNLWALGQSNGVGSGEISEHRASTCLPGDSACRQRKSRVGNGSFSDGATGCIVMDGEITC